MMLVDCDVRVGSLIRPFYANKLKNEYKAAATNQDVSDLLERPTGTVDWYSESIAYQTEETPGRLFTGPVGTIIRAEADSIVIGQPDHEMAQLEKAADREDVREFVLALGQMDWRERKAADYIKCVKLALSVGAHLAARKFAMEGNERYPDHPALAKMAYILAPPKTRIITSLPDPTLSADNDWFSKHSHEYRGQWVAVINGVLLGHSTDPNDIKKIPNWDKATITRIVE